MPKIDTYKGDAVALGPVSLPVEWLKAAAAEDFARNGVVLANERTKIVIMDEATGLPVSYTLSLYASRSPIGEEECAKVDGIKAEKTAAAAVKAEAEEAKQAREKQRAFELGQQSTIGAIQNLSALAQGARVLDALRK